MQQEGAAGSIWRDPVTPWLVWPGLALALSPVLAELADHMTSHAWARMSLVFPWLAWVAVRRDPEGAGTESRRVIWISLLVGLGIVILAVAGDMLRLGRVALAICGVGVVFGAGWARATAALVLVWVVPLPSMLVNLLSPALEATWGTVAAALVPGVALESVANTPSLAVRDTSLPLLPADGGLALGFGLAGLGWFRSAVTGGAVSSAIGRSLRWVALMAPIQVATVVTASAVLAGGATPSGARWILDESGWILVVGLGLVLSIRTLCEASDVPTGEVLC